MILPLLSFRAKPRNLILIAVIAGMTGNLLSCSRTAEDIHLSDYVSTLVGTQSDWTFSTGNTYPAIALPWGMNFWTPVTAEREDYRIQADASALALDQRLRRLFNPAFHGRGRLRKLVLP